MHKNKRKIQKLWDSLGFLRLFTAADRIERPTHTDLSLDIVKFLAQNRLIQTKEIPDRFYHHQGRCKGWAKKHLVKILTNARTLTRTWCSHWTSLQWHLLAWLQSSARSSVMRKRSQIHWEIPELRSFGQRRGTRMGDSGRGAGESLCRMNLQILKIS